MVKRIKDITASTACRPARRTLITPDFGFLAYI